MAAVSQKTLVEVMRALRKSGIDYKEILYEQGFPDWFVMRAQNGYEWEWQNIVIALRNGSFFDPPNYFSDVSITGEYLSQEDRKSVV